MDGILGVGHGERDDLPNGVIWLDERMHTLFRAGSRRIQGDMSPDYIADFLTEETAVRAALRPTCWLAEVSAKSHTVSVIVGVVAKDADAPELAYEQASRFVATKYGATAGVPARKPCAVPGSETRPKSRRALT